METTGAGACILDGGIHVTTEYTEHTEDATVSFGVL